MADSNGSVTVDTIRDDISTLLKEIDTLIEGAKGLDQARAGKMIAEATLARRHLEDARMRVGVYEMINIGKDPWASKLDRSGVLEGKKENA